MDYLPRRDARTPWEDAQQTEEGGARVAAQNTNRGETAGQPPATSSSTLHSRAIISGDMGGVGAYSSRNSSKFSTKSRNLSKTSDSSPYYPQTVENMQAAANWSSVRMRGPSTYEMDARPEVMFNESLERKRHGREATRYTPTMKLWMALGGSLIVLVVWNITQMVLWQEGACLLGDDTREDYIVEHSIERVIESGLAGSLAGIHRKHILSEQKHTKLNLKKK